MSSTPTLTPEERTRYWQKHVDAWQASSQSQLAFCKSHALNYPRFVYWLGKFRRREAEQKSSQAPRFVPVTRSAPQSIDGLSLVLPNGLQVRGICTDNLAVVHQLLGSLT